MITASAPGKLMLAGEYAVLDGGPAIVAAVDRRVTAKVAATGPLSPFLQAAAAQVAAARGATSAAARAARSMTVDSEALRSGEHKLGLGSSAAATVAAIAAALGHDDGFDLARDRALVLRLARDAHAEAQGKKGARGSGADVAAITLGGVIRFVAPARDAGDGAQPEVSRVALPLDLVLVPFWTGRSADTPQLVVAVREARSVRPAAVEAALAAIADAAAALATAADAAAALAALDAGGHAIAALGAAAHIDLETEAVRSARRVSAALGGTAKSCGAGGGDVALAAVPAGQDGTDLRRRLVEAGCQPLDLAVDPRGVELVDTRPSAQ